jgi:hypothetical protein
MIGANFADGTPQDLYFPENHTTYPGRFKGMKIILEECSLKEEANLRSECPEFKCPDPSDSNPKCCVRCVLMNQPDFAAIKSKLEMVCAEKSFEILFLPKFHCELNLIEMCWKYAKKIYCLNPESSSEEDLEWNALAALDIILIGCMQRFVNHSL